MSIGILDCLKHERDIRIKAELSGGKTGFGCTRLVIGIGSSIIDVAVKKVPLYN